MPIDYVLGPGSYQWRGDCLVRLDDRYRQCIVLIGTGSVGSEDEISPWGTGFLVGVESPKSLYLVTAWHVVADKIDAPFDVRLNRRGGGAGLHPIEDPNWIVHPTDNSVDVAVHEINIPEWADYTFIPKYPNILLEDRIESKDIGAGNRTYTVGLWKFLHGDHHNQPFVYSGHIGLMPEDEKIPVRPWLQEHGDNRVLVDAYLVEGEPLNGASGSPVFVRRTIRMKVTEPGGKRPVNVAVEGSVWLLGLLSDVFTARPGDDYEIPTGGHSMLMPRGVNVVVPSLKIVEVLDHPELKAIRSRAIEEVENQKTPMKAVWSPATVDNSQQKEEGNGPLDVVVKGSDSDDQI